MLVEIENRDCLELSPAIENITNVSKKRKKVLKVDGILIFNFFILCCCRTLLVPSRWSLAMATELPFYPF